MTLVFMSKAEQRFKDTAKKITRSDLVSVVCQNYQPNSPCYIKKKGLSLNDHYMWVPRASQYNVQLTTVRRFSVRRERFRFSVRRLETELIQCWRSSPALPLLITLGFFTNALCELSISLWFYPHTWENGSYNHSFAHEDWKSCLCNCLHFFVCFHMFAASWNMCMICMQTRLC